MSASAPSQPQQACSLWQMFPYSMGECANSLVMNGIFGFAMLYYTKALGLEPAWAGMAMSVSVFYEAITDPVMGHLSDNTRSRWGRRHPYMIVGGLLMALCSFLIWTVPHSFFGRTEALFSYLVVMNLLLRTGLTMFFIPYVALGFEMCQDYHGRSKLQSLRQIMNMAANLAGPAMAWSIFFRDKAGVQATTVASNYMHMGATFAVATAVFVIICVIFTSRWNDDSSQLPRHSGEGSVATFLANMRQIVLDRYARCVFIFILIVCAGMVLVSSLQMFVYDDFMHFPAYQKTIAHGSTMVGMALGAFLSVALAQRFEKRGAVVIGGIISVICNAMLGMLFLTGWVPPHSSQALPLFVLFHAGYWFGSGVMLPISTSMMADISEIHLLHTGENRDGTYSAVYSLAMRISIAFSLFVSGYVLQMIGYQVATGSQVVTQSPQAIWRLGFVTFVIGAAVGAIAALVILRYPVNRRFLDNLRRKDSVERESSPASELALTAPG